MMSRPFYNANYDSSKDISSVALIGIDNSLSMHNTIDDNISNIISNIIDPLNDNIRIIIFTLDEYKILYDNQKNNININLLDIRKTYKSNSLNAMNEFIKQYNNYLNRYLFIISDGQENLFTSDFENESSTWYINYVNARKPHANLSITDIQSNSNLILANDIFQISVDIKNTGYEDMNNQLVELFINDINIGKRYIDLPINTSKRILFDLTIPDYGEHLCLIKIENDDIKADNTLYFTINLKENIHIDVIDNNSNNYLKNILTSFNITNSIVKLHYYNTESYINSNTRNNILFILGLNNLTDKLNSKITQKSYDDKLKMIVFPDLSDKNFIYLKHILPEFKFNNSYRKKMEKSQYLEIDVKSIQDKNLKNIYSDNHSRNIKVFNYIKMEADTNTVMILNNNDTSPYNSFLFQGHVLDEKGNKMSKSTGNVLDASELLSKYPVDLTRFYFMWKSSPIETLNFSTKELMSRPYQILSTLFHIHLYFKQNSEYDKFDISQTTIDWAKNKGLLDHVDIWLLSKLQKTIQMCTESNKNCKFHESAKAIEDFLINSLSQIYIPMTKQQLWDDDETKKDKRHAIYAILANALKNLDVLIHPFSPFTSEYLYQTIFEHKKSILLELWPKPVSSLINESIEESFDLMIDAVSVSAAARMKAKLKRRWPLNQAIICVEKGEHKKIELLSDLLRSQLNVEECKIIELENHVGMAELLEMKKAGLPVIAKVELERKGIGPKAKQHMGKLLEIFASTDPEEIVQNLDKNGSFTFDVDGNKISLDNDDFVVDFDIEEGFAYSKRNNLIGIISTTRNEELMAKGLVKDLARRLQSLRKERGYNPTDILNTASVLELDQESLDMLKDKTDELAFLVRVKQVNFTHTCKEYKDDDIDGQKIKISVE